MKKILIIFLCLGLLISTSYYVYLIQNNVKNEKKVDNISKEIDILIEKKQNDNLNEKEEKYERLYNENQEKIKEYERWKKMNKKIESYL